MPIHDWTRVEAGIFHHFHLEWISRIAGALNSDLLPSEYYALAEQQASRVTPDVLTLRGLGAGGDGEEGAADGDDRPDGDGGGMGLELARPRARVTAEADAEISRRKQRVVTVRHVSGDDVVAMVEIVSPGNKDSRRALDLFVGKVVWLLEHRIHQLILDLHPPTSRDPRGIHGAIWDEIGPQPYDPPPDQPLTLAAYEYAGGYRAYVEPVAVGDAMPDMPLFLKTEAYVEVPLEATYRAAFDAVPRRWRKVLEPS
jgi:hypothetical protein